MQPSIGVLASRPVLAVEADTLALQALRLMNAHQISRIVVLHNAEPVGILTERDVAFTANWVVGQPTLLIREVMSKPVLTASAETTLDEAHQLFREHDVRHLVVVGGKMEMCGIFSSADLVRARKGTVFPEDCTVSALMSRRVLCVAPEVPARHALALMASHAISGVVVSQAGRPLGVFGESEAVALVAAGSDLGSLSVATAMIAPIVTIPAQAPPDRAIDLMQFHAVRRLVVTDEQGAMTGILTQTDLSRVLDQQDQPGFDAVGQAATAAATYSPGPACC